MTTNSRMSSNDRPLNILLSIEKEVLDRQLRLQQEQPYLMPAGGRGSAVKSPPGGCYGIYGGIDSSNAIFVPIKRLLVHWLGHHLYTVYPISGEELKSKPWQASTALLILVIAQDEEEYLVSADSVLKDFISGGGKVIIFRVDELWRTEQHLITGECLEKRKFKDKLLTGLGKDFFRLSGAAPRSVKFEQDLDCPQSDDHRTRPSIAHLHTPDGHRVGETFLRKNGIRLLTGHEEEEEKEEAPSGEHKLNLRLNSSVEELRDLFELTEYKRHLRTKRLGRHFLYSDIVSSTMSVADLFIGWEGLTAVAGQQTEGRGRGENEWLSPAGCLAFTLTTSVSLNSQLGRRLGFVQHLAALALVKAVRAQPGLADVPLGLKWPNDIYWEKHLKLGGILVTAKHHRNAVHCLIGIGFNLDNALPTASLNNLLKDMHLGPLKKELLLAETLNQLECLMEKFEVDGVESAKAEYVEHWVHKGQIVRMANTKQVSVEELDNDGFLLVRDVQTGICLSVHPDGNRFDMLGNLLVKK